MLNTTVSTKNLKLGHAVACAVHLGLAVWATYEASHTNRKWDPAVYILQTEWFQKGTSLPCTEVNDGCVVVSRVGGSMPVNTYALIATFFWVSAVAEFIYARKDNGMAGSMRWFEYAVSAAIQFFVISILSNNVEFFSAFFSAILIAFLQMTGYVLEQSLKQRTVSPPQGSVTPQAEESLCLNLNLNLNPFVDCKWRVDRQRNEQNASMQAPNVSFMHRLKTPTHFQTAVFCSAFLVLLVAWSAVFYHMHKARHDVPAFVWAIVGVSFAFYVSFGVVMLVRLMLPGSSKRCEVGYTVLSVFAKAGVMLIYFFGTRMRDGLVTSAG